MAKHPGAQHAGAAPSALDELLDAERQIAARNAEVAVECAAMIAKARADSSAIESNAAAALATELLALDAASQRARDALVRDIEADAARAMARFEQLGDDDILRLAELIATRVTGLATSPTAGASA